MEPVTAAFGAYAIFQTFGSLFGPDPLKQRRGMVAAARADEIKGIRQTSSSYGKAVPIVFGTTRIAGNLIFLPSETYSHIVYDGPGESAAMAFGIALCEGPIQGVGACWKDSQVFDSLAGLKAGEVMVVGSGDLIYPWPDGADDYHLLTGDIPGTPYVWPTPSPLAHADMTAYSEYGYSGTAWLAHHLVVTFPWGQSGLTSIPNLQFEVKSGTTRDASAADVFLTLTTDRRRGCGWDSSRIDSAALDKFRSYTGAEGFGISWAIEQQESALSLIKFLLDACNSNATESGGRIKIIPYGDQDIAANGYTYTANHTPVWDLDDDDFIVTEGQQPIRIEQRSEVQCPNCVPVEFLDGRFVYWLASDGKRSASAYETKPAESAIMSDAARTLPGGTKKGVVRGAPIPLHCFTNKDAAQKRSRLYAQRSVGVLNRYTFNTSWKQIRGEKGDLFRISSAAMGLTPRVVRVTGRRRDRKAGPKGEIEFTCEDAPFGTYTASAYTVEEGDGSAGTPTSVAPASARAPVIVMPPYRVGGQHYAWVASSGDATVGKIDVWASWDGTNYARAGTLGRCTYGVLASPLAVGGPVDLVNTLSVTLTNGSLASASVADRDNLATACWVGGEVVSYSTATPSGGNVNLTGLRRGCRKSLVGSHLAADVFVRLDDAPVRIPIPDSRRGQTLRIRCVATNATGTLAQQLTDATVYTFAVPRSYKGGNLPWVMSFDQFDRDQWKVWGTWSPDPVADDGEGAVLDSPLGSELYG